MGEDLVCVTDPGRELSHVITHMFLHGSWMHLLGNMWFLWLFGNNIEDSMTRPRFRGLLSALRPGGGAAAGVLHDPASPVPMVGASGAISGVMGAYLVLYPRVRVFTMVPLGFFITQVALPAWVMLVYWVALQLFGGLSTGRRRGRRRGVLGARRRLPGRHRAREAVRPARSRRRAPISALAPGRCAAALVDADYGLRATGGGRQATGGGGGAPVRAPATQSCASLVGLTCLASGLVLLQASKPPCLQASKPPSIEHDRPIADQEDAVLEHQLERLGEHDLLDIAAGLRHLLRAVAVIDRMTSCAMMGPSSSSSVTKCAVAPMIFTPRSNACRYGLAPTNAGRNEWWMLMIRPA